MLERYYKTLQHKRRTDTIYSGSIPTTTSITGVSFTTDIYPLVIVSGLTQTTTITIGGDNVNTIVFESNGEQIGSGPLRSVTYVSSSLSSASGNIIVKAVDERGEPVQFVKSLSDIRGVIGDLRYPLVTTELGEVITLDAMCACNSQDIQVHDYIISSGTTYTVVSVSRVENSFSGSFHHTECKLTKKV